MALIRCTECGNVISDKSSACPRCGNPTHPAPTPPPIKEAPMATPEVPVKKRTNPAVWLVPCIALVAILAAVTVYLAVRDDSKPEQVVVVPAGEDTLTVVEEAPAEEGAPEAEPAAEEAAPVAEEAAAEEPASNLNTCYLGGYFTDGSRRWPVAIEMHGNGSQWTSATYYNLAYGGSLKMNVYGSGDGTVLKCTNKDFTIYLGHDCTAPFDGTVGGTSQEAALQLNVSVWPASSLSAAKSQAHGAI